MPFGRVLKTRPQTNFLVVALWSCRVQTEVIGIASFCLLISLTMEYFPLYETKFMKIAPCQTSEEINYKRKTMYNTEL